MNTYKVTNITNTAGKRDSKFNSELNIDYVDNMVKKTVKVKPGDSVYLTVHSLPLSVRKLRVEKLVTVIEIGKQELANLMSGKTNKPKPFEIAVPEDNLQKPARKKTIKKDVE